MAEMSNNEAIRTIITHQDCLIRSDECNHECDKCVLDVPFVKLDKALTMAIKALSQPEIIHCAECIHFKECIGAYDDYCICARDKLHPFKVRTDGSGFCYWAERRTDA